MLITRTCYLLSLIKLSEMGIFYINDLIINTSNNNVASKFQVLEYAQIVDRANGKPKKGKSPKVFEIIKKYVLDCIFTAKLPLQSISDNLENTTSSIKTTSLIQDSANSNHMIT